jgi:plastocyanin
MIHQHPFFILFVSISVVLSFTAVVYAQISTDNYPASSSDNAYVSIPPGTSVPGCESIAGCYLPFHAKIDVGSKVTWSNDDSAAHTVTSGTPADGPDGNFDSGLLMAGSTFSVTLDESGEYPYFCMVHPWMEGMVIVKNSSPESNSNCGVGTMFDYASNSCILIMGEDGDTENVEEIFEFNIRKDRYVDREPIFIDGYVKYHKNPPYINIKILENNVTLVENVYVLLDKDNYFFYHTKSSQSWEIPTNYTVRVTYDGKSSEKYFDLVTNDKDYNPQSVESLQTKLGKLKIDNHNLQQKIKELEEALVQKEEEMNNMFCYKVPT